MPRVRTVDTGLSKMASPLSQLYCKRLSASNVEEFLWAQPDHVGWQINLSKLLPDELARAVDASRVVATRLKGTGPAPFALGAANQE